MRETETNSVEDFLEHHYWKAVTFLVILILAGTGFWGMRRFAPALFLGEPNLIAVPDTQRPQGSTAKSLVVNKPELLNINTASAKELQTLPNIGERTAERIIDHRTQHGAFATVDALQEIKGIGPKTIEKLRPFVDAE